MTGNVGFIEAERMYVVTQETLDFLSVHLNDAMDVYLYFSVAKDSSVLAHLMSPWQSKVTLVFVDTGIVAPHVIEHIRRYTHDFKVAVIESSAPKVWEAYGTPAPFAAVRKHRSRRVLPAGLCCDAVVSHPVRTFAKARPDAVHVTGVRKDDSERLSGDDGKVVSYDDAMETPVAEFRSEHVPTIRPLWDWTQADVFRYVEEHNIELPFHYGEGVTSSLDCLSCTAHITRVRMAFLRRHYPDVAAYVQETADANLADLEQAMDAYRDALVQPMLITPT